MGRYLAPSFGCFSLSNLFLMLDRFVVRSTVLCSAQMGATLLGLGLLLIGDA